MLPLWWVGQRVPWAKRLTVILVADKRLTSPPLLASGYDDARGDQCDECGQTLEAAKLKNPRCKWKKGCTSVPQPKESTNLYLDLKTLQPEIEAWFKEATTKAKWPSNAQVGDPSPGCHAWRHRTWLLEGPLVIAYAQ